MNTLRFHAKCSTGFSLLKAFPRFVCILPHPTPQLSHYRRQRHTGATKLASCHGPKRQPSRLSGAVRAGEKYDGETLRGSRRSRHSTSAPAVGGLTTMFRTNMAPMRTLNRLPHIRCQETATVRTTVDRDALAAHALPPHGPRPEPPMRTPPPHEDPTAGALRGVSRPLTTCFFDESWMNAFPRPRTALLRHQAAPYQAHGPDKFGKQGAMRHERLPVIPPFTSCPCKQVPCASRCSFRSYFK